MILSYPNAVFALILEIEKQNEKIDSALLSFKKLVLNRNVLQDFKIN